MIFKWLKKRKQEKIKKTRQDLFFQKIKRFKEIKEEMDEIIWYLFEHHREHLHDQTAMFYEKAEFMMTSLYTCLHRAKQSMNTAIVENKLKELNDGIEEETTEEIITTTDDIEPKAFIN